MPLEVGLVCFLSEILRFALKSHVIPALRPKAFGRQAAKVGIQLAEADPRLRGGDENPNFNPMVGPQAHDHSE